MKLTPVFFTLILPAKLACFHPTQLTVEELLRGLILELETLLNYRFISFLSLNLY
jgi:hypothetical protein